MFFWQISSCLQFLLLDSSRKPKPNLKYNFKAKDFHYFSSFCLIWLSFTKYSANWASWLGKSKITSVNLKKMTRLSIKVNIRTTLVYIKQSFVSYLRTKTDGGFQTWCSPRDNLYIHRKKQLRQCRDVLTEAISVNSQHIIQVNSFSFTSKVSFSVNLI